MSWKHVLSCGLASMLLVGGMRSTVQAVDAASVVSSKPLNDLFAKQWVKITPEGSIRGSIVEFDEHGKQPLGGLPIAIVKDGKVVSAVRADANGTFEFKGITPDSYSLIVRTNESFSAFALQVLDGEAGQHLPDAIEVRPVRQSGSRVKEIVRTYAMPMSLVTVDNIDDEVVSVDPIADERRFASTHIVRLDDSGVLRGQLAKSGIDASRSALDDMTVFVLQAGEEVARVSSKQDGSFEIPGLAPGIYGFVAAGSRGFAATALQVVDASLAVRGTNGVSLVSLNMQDCCPVMNCEVVPTCEVSCCEPQVIETVIEAPMVAACEQPVEEVIVDQCGVAPTCGGGCGCGWGGGYGGGGGGGGGLFGGGFGPLLGLAGLAGIAAIIANDDDDDGGTNFNDRPNQTTPLN